MARNVGGTTECINSLLNDVGETRHPHHESMADGFEQSRTWLVDVIETCKRKIHEVHEPAGFDKQQKKSKTHVVDDKENSNPNQPEINEENEDDKHPDDDIDVNSLKVVQLRQELRQRNIDATGLKKDLQKRLTAALNNARVERERKRKVAKAAHRSTTQDQNPPKDTKKELCSAAKEEKETVKETLAKTSEENRMEIDEKIDPQSKADNVMADDMDVEVQNETTEEKAETRAGAAVVSSDEHSDSVSASDVVMDCASISKPHLTGTEGIDTSAKSTSSAVPLSKRGSMKVSNLLTAETALSQQTTESSRGTGFELTSMNSFSDNEASDETSQKKNGIGRKLIKATSKLFSPSKKKDQMKNIRSPPLKEITSSQKGHDEMEVIDEGQSVQSGEDSSVALPQDVNEQASEPPKKEIVKSFTSTAACGLPDPEKKSSQHLQSSSASTASKRAEEKRNVQMALKSSGNPTEPSSAKSSNSLSTNSSSAGSKNSAHAKKMALSKARLDEIRGKSKPIALSQSTRDKFATANTSASKKTALKSHTSALTSSSSGKSESKTSSKVRDDDKDAKRKMLKEQMREKAKMNSAVAASLKKNRPQQLNTQQPRVVSTPGQKHMQSHHSHDTKQVEQQQMKPISPMDTYEISDREDSDSDESDYEDDKPHKKIPKWAQRSNLIVALEKQFDMGKGRIDPDHIFPEVQTCDLEEIFDQKKLRYKKRTSSGNWTQDRVTAKEKLVYKRQMGYKSK